LEGLVLAPVSVVAVLLMQVETAALEVMLEELEKVAELAVLGWKSRGLVVALVSVLVVPLRTVALALVARRLWLLGLKLRRMRVGVMVVVMESVGLEVQSGWPPKTDHAQTSVQSCQ